MLFTSGMRKEFDSPTEHLSQEMEGCLEEMPCVFSVRVMLSASTEIISLRPFALRLL